MIQLSLIDAFHADADRLHARAYKVRMMIRARWLKTMADAGLDPSCGAIHTHNAMVGLWNGKPWPGVDYRLVRKCKRLESLMYEPDRLVSAVLSRRLKSLHSL